jgi:hypothetical protein
LCSRRSASSLCCKTQALLVASISTHQERVGIHQLLSLAESIAFSIRHNGGGGKSLGKPVLRVQATEPDRPGESHASGLEDFDRARAAGRAVSLGRASVRLQEHQRLHLAGKPRPRGGSIPSRGGPGHRHIEEDAPTIDSGAMGERNEKTGPHPRGATRARNRSDLEDQTISFRLLRARIFTTFRAGLALNMTSSPVKRLMPL